ncbi:DMT family transporter [Ancylobacter oerskovii]|uniref:DMT family transporter n=1 Tax=Ancylobacter oerskovii TaxID=459519 RepID=A0ABW4YZW2_9HYPH|nr:DMT family transporter [Ancylobacter oerskovii]MBS7543006.1 DMT family transporter [Ancylobacter oerskovii]
MSSPSAIRRGILLMIAGSSVFAANDAFSKLAIAHIPPSQIIAVRGLLAALALVAMLGWKGDLAAIRFAADRRVLLRGALEACSAVLFITALATMALGDSAAIVQVAPLATMAGAVLFFGSRIGVRQWLAVGVGFSGVLLIVKPGTTAFDMVALMPLGSALLIALRDFVTGRIGTHVPTLVVTLTTTAVGMAMGFAGATVEAWRPLDLLTLAYLAGGGITLISGHILTIAAFRGNDPAVIAPFRYATVACSVTLSAVVFGQTPDLVSIGGMALIMAAGLYTMHDHRKLALVKPAAKESGAA